MRDIARKGDYTYEVAVLEDNGAYVVVERFFGVFWRSSAWTFTLAMAALALYESLVEKRSKRGV